MKSSIVLACLFGVQLGCSEQVTIHLPQREESESFSNEADSDEPGSSGSMTPVDGCWQLPVVDRVRLFPMPGRADALVGGKIVGSVASATNNFVDLVTITEAPADGTWLEVEFDNDQQYRFVKYYGPPGSHGVVAEVELYADDELLTGKGFGSAGEGGSLENGFALALDGDENS